MEIDLQIRPDKCTSILFDGKKLLTNSSMPLPCEKTRDIRSAPTKFLGGFIAHNRKTARLAASDHLSTTITSALRKLEKSPIRGEYKIWVLKHYVGPSVNFFLAIDDIPKCTLKSIQGKITKHIKKWLNLPRSTTQAVLHHPAILDLPFLPHLYTKSKVDYLRSISTSRDPLLQELYQGLSQSILEKAFCSEALDILKAARDSIGDIIPNRMPPALKKASKQISVIKQSSFWDNHLSSLSVQSKFKDIIALESECPIWRKIQFGLPAGQLSFLLKAGADCLPTPLNLRRWKVQTDQNCPLCSSPHPISFHILNWCETALSQGRYTWRHDSVLKSLVNSIKPFIDPQSSLFADLPGLRASNNPMATIPCNLSTSSDRPDLVIITGTKIYLLELTVPANTPKNMVEASVRKQQKYQPLITDLLSHPDVHQVVYHTLEIGCLGHFSSSVVRSLTEINDSISKTNAREILSKAASKAVGCSSYIFGARLSKDWDSNKPLYS